MTDIQEIFEQYREALISRRKDFDVDEEDDCYEDDDCDCYCD